MESMDSMESHAPGVVRQFVPPSCLVCCRAASVAEARNPRRRCHLVACMCAWGFIDSLYVHDCVAFVWNHSVHLQSDNELGAEGAKALAPEVGKLTKLRTLSLEGD